MTFGNMYCDERWARIERTGRVRLNERAVTAFAAYRAAFVALVDAELALERCHCPPPEWRAEFARLRAEHCFADAHELEHEWLRGNDERRRVALDAQFAAEAALARARARFEAESKAHPEHWRWYVSARDGEQFGVVLGPFDSPEAAADAVPVGAQLALDHCRSDVAFAAFGVAAGDPRELGEGRLNRFA